MKKYLHFDLVVGYFFVFAIIMLCQSFTFKATERIISIPPNKKAAVATNANQTYIRFSIVPDYSNALSQHESEKDSLDFEVKLIKPRIFLLSFYKKQTSDIFIKIYDVLGNLVHQEKR